MTPFTEVFVILLLSKGFNTQAFQFM